MDQINDAIKAFKESEDYQTLTEKWFSSAEAAE